MSKIYVVKKNSKNGKPYISMYIDLDYKQMFISFNDGDIAQILGVSVKSLYELTIDEPQLVARLEVGDGE